MEYKHMFWLRQGHDTYFKGWRATVQTGLPPPSFKVGNPPGIPFKLVLRIGASLEVAHFEIGFRTARSCVSSLHICR